MRDRSATRALVLGLLSSDASLKGETSAAAGLVAGILGLAALVVGIAYWFLASA